MKNPSFFVIAGPLLLVLFIDGMGLGIVIPLLNGLIFNSDSSFLRQVTSPLMHNAIYGGIIGIFMFCWFFGAAVLGDLSDQIGRKKSLIICLIGAFLGYILSAVAVLLDSLVLLILGRIIAGFTSGSQPIAQAAIVDLSTPETKTRNIGYILLAISLGFVFGPLLGGVLSDPRIVSWFDYTTPFYFAAFISFVNIILLKFIFKETFISKSTTFKINPAQAIQIFISAFQHDAVRVLSIIFFIFIFGWGSYYSFIALYLIHSYHSSPLEISLFMMVIGIGFGLGTGYIANYLAARFPLREIFIFSSLLSGLLVILMLLIPYALASWLLLIPMTAGVAVSYTSLLTMFSNQVDEKSQGWVMGITGSILAFDWGLNGIVVGFIAALDTSYPICIASLFMLIAALSMFFFFKSRQ